jgi:hypothetical protein
MCAEPHGRRWTTASSTVHVDLRLRNFPQWAGRNTRLSLGPGILVGTISRANAQNFFSQPDGTGVALVRDGLRGCEGRARQAQGFALKGAT